MPSFQTTQSTFGHADAASARGTALDNLLQNAVRTRQINDFLSEDSKSFVIGAKGMGKSLVLLQKAHLKAANASVIKIPAAKSILVDRLTAAEDVGLTFSRRTTQPGIGQTAWIAVWKNAILKSCLNHLAPGGKFADVDISGAETQRVILSQITNHVTQLVGKHYNPRGPFEFYADILHQLDDSPNSIQQIRQQNSELKDLLKLKEQPIHVFMDNLDSYYESEPELWFDSMFGLFKCVPELRFEFPHIHVFSSLRKDVYNNFETEHRTNLLDYATDLHYTNEHLLKIFENGIRQLDPSRLRARNWLEKKGEPFNAFFGPENQWIPCRFTDEQKHIREVILHHSLLRPRDMITLGNMLVELDQVRLSPGGIRSCVENAAEEIARQYLAEIKPSLPGAFALPHFLKNFVPGNILTRNDLASATKRFNQTDEGKEAALSEQDPSLFNPFAILYTTGLLGVVQHQSSGATQRFLLPGEEKVSATAGQLPESSHYFVHPILNPYLPITGVARNHYVGYSVFCSWTLTG